MTRIEDRLRNALAEEADSRTVDVLRMRGDLDDRLGRRPRRSRALMGAAAAALLVGGAVVGVQVLRDDDPGLETASAGEVDDEFSCPQVEHVDLSGAQDEFLPDLVDRTPAEVAREYDAPRWEFVEDGDTARLRLGNADGTLGSETNYSRRDGEWRAASSVVCSNGTSADPASDALRLGLHGYEPLPARDDLAFGGNATPLLVDDRAAYDYSGLVTRHRSLYLVPCGVGLCFATGGPDGSIGDRMPTYYGRDTAILGTMCWFFVPDVLIGRASPYALIVAWDALGRTTDFAVSGPGGSYEGKSFRDPSWGRQRVWLALVPTPPSGIDLLARLHDANGLVDEYHGPAECD
jgi:hypothetical protein